MKLTASQITKLNKMNRAAQDIALGTALGTMAVTGKVSASSAQAGASAIVITTGLTSVTGYTLQRFISGSATLDYVVNSSGSLTVTAVTGGSIITEGDVVNWLAW